MKNKRTKFTALLLSALMAVSTITSVTWAADLFTDGSAGTEVTIGSVEDVTQVSDDDATLTEWSGVVDAVDVTQTNDPDDKDYDPKTDTGVYQIAGGWVLNYKLKDSQGETYDQIYSYVLKDGEYTYTSANCTNKAKISYKVTLVIDEQPITVVNSVQYGAVDTNAHGRVEKTESAAGSTCEKDKSDQDMESDDQYKTTTYTFAYCPYCDKLYTTSNTLGTYTRDQLLAGSLSATELSQYGIKKEESHAKHSFGDWKYEEINTAKLDSTFWASASVGGLKGDSLKKAAENAKVTNNQLDVYDRSLPAVVRRWRQCSICKREDPYVATHSANPQEEIEQWYIFWTGDKQGETVYYEFTADSNIKGFVAYDANSITNGNDENKDGGNGDLYILPLTSTDKVTHSDGTVAYRIPESDFKGVVLDNCNLGGYYLKSYYIKESTSYGSSGVKDYTHCELKQVSPKEHTYGSTFVDISNKDTQLDNLGKDNKNGSNGVKVSRDGSGNITTAYSKDCTTDANYVISHTCLSCGVKQVVSTQAASKGDHSFSIWSVDQSKTEYKMIDDSQHLIHYFDSRYCQVCGLEQSRDSMINADKKEFHGELIEKKIEDGTEIEPNCGNAGSYNSGRGCSKCEYVIEETITRVELPATDKHDFGDNEPYFIWVGKVQVGNKYNRTDDPYSDLKVVGQIVRDCTICGKPDSNGIGGVKAEAGRVGGETVSGVVDVAHMIPGTADPVTGVQYSCSESQVPIVVEWKGYIDGKVREFNETTTVPYYATLAAYQGRTAHTPGTAVKEVVKEATAEEEGLYNLVTRCTVCGDVVSTEPHSIPKLTEVSVPSVTAASVDYDTINVSWTAVEGATAYRLYYRSSDEGINKWFKVRRFSSEVTSYPVNGLTTGSKYRFTVRAEVTKDGKTELSEYDKKGAVAVPKLTAPEIKSVTVSGKTTKVTWSRVDGASGYIVFRNSKRVGTVTKGSKVSWTDKKPVNGATYQVRAYRTEDKKNYKSDLSAPK